MGGYTSVSGSSWFEQMQEAERKREAQRQAEDEACEDAAAEFAKCVTISMLGNAQALEAELAKMARLYLRSAIGTLHARIAALEAELEKLRSCD